MAGPAACVADRTEGNVLLVLVSLIEFCCG